MLDKMFDFERLHSAIAELRSKQIFFVGGAVKSGTTWLQLLLDAHPEVSCRGEGHLPNNFASLLQDALSRQNEYVSAKQLSISRELRRYPDFNYDHFCYLLASAITLLLDEQGRIKFAKAIGEKTPDNICFLEILNTVFPSAKVIQVVRDGRDCAVSDWFQNQRVNSEWLRGFKSIDDYVIYFAGVWRDALSVGTAFATRFPTRCLILRYEDLSADPARTLSRVFQFLGVSYSESIVMNCCAEASFEKMSGGRPRGQENRASFFRKGVVGDWRVHLSERARKGFEEAAGEWLARFDYPCSGAGSAADSPKVTFESALALHQQGRFHEAEQYYTILLKGDPHDFHALFNFGTMRAQQRQFDDALRLFREALEIWPDHPDALNNLRIVTLAQKALSAPGSQALRQKVQETPTDTLPLELPATVWGTKGFQFWTFLSMLLTRSSCSRLLELGSGRSTITLAEYASFRRARFVSIETSQLWFNKARVELRCLGLPESPIHLVGWASDGGWYDLEEFRPVVGTAGGFDFAFIDGPNREDGGSARIRDSETALRETRSLIAEADVVVVDDVHRRHILVSLDMMLGEPGRYDKFYYDYSIGRAHPNTLCLCLRKGSAARAALDSIRQALDLPLYELMDANACPEP